jgi:hypothetical protein
MNSGTETAVGTLPITQQTNHGPLGNRCIQKNDPTFCFKPMWKAICYRTNVVAYNYRTIERKLDSKMAADVYASLLVLHMNSVVAVARSVVGCLLKEGTEINVRDKMLCRQEHGRGETSLSASFQATVTRIANGR